MTDNENDKNNENKEWDIKYWAKGEGPSVIPPVDPEQKETQAAVQVGLDVPNKMVVVQFSQAYKWLRMASDQAKMLAQILWHHAAELDRQTLDSLDPMVTENSKVVPIFKKKEPSP